MKRRPLGVTILAVLILLFGLLVSGLSLFLLVLSLLHYTGNVPPALVVALGRLSMLDLFLVTAQAALGVFALVSGIGMLRLRPWAWLIGMLLLGCELVIQLSNYFQGRPAYLVLFVTALLVFYLNQRPIREAFSIEPRSSAVPASIHIEPVGSTDAVEPPGALEP
ncbi:MAG TPA: hypothetical protein VH599_17960 [Ktedonobacterales bacterium]